MGQLLLYLVVGLTVAAIVFGVTVLIGGSDPGLAPTEPDGRAVPLPTSRPLVEADVAEVRFDTAVRGYRMAQVDQAMRRAAYDIGYKDELIDVLEAEVTALREGRTGDADVLRRAREAAQAPAGSTTLGAGGASAVSTARVDEPTRAADRDRPDLQPAAVPERGSTPQADGGTRPAVSARPAVGPRPTVVADAEHHDTALDAGDRPEPEAAAAGRELESGGGGSGKTAGDGPYGETSDADPAQSEPAVRSERA